MITVYYIQICLFSFILTYEPKTSHPARIHPAASLPRDQLSSAESTRQLSMWSQVLRYLIDAAADVNIAGARVVGWWFQIYFECSPQRLDGK